MLRTTMLPVDLHAFREGAVREQLSGAGPLDKELGRCGHRFARYAGDFLVMVKSATAAERVMASLTRFIEGRLKLVVNRVKSRAAPLRECTFLGFQIGARGRAVWTDKAHARFKQQVREITSRNRGHRVQDVIDELRRYVTGWLNYFGISHTYNQVVELAEWVRRRVRLYYWKQWKRPRTRRRHLLALGTDPTQVHMATRSRKGYRRMSGHPAGQQDGSRGWPTGLVPGEPITRCPSQRNLPGPVRIRPAPILPLQAVFQFCSPITSTLAVPRYLSAPVRSAFIEYQGHSPMHPDGVSSESDSMFLL
jgi:hypothetical protein